MSLGGPADESLLTGLRLQWQEAERRLYPLATTTPDLYMLAVRVVRAVADDLATVASPQELVQRWEDRDAVVVRAQQAVEVTVPADVPSDHIAGAAFALRDREMAQEREAADRRARAVAARERGQSWAVLHERGDVSRGLADPHQCIELHLGSGLAIVSTVEQEPSTAGTNFVVSVIEMDDLGVQVLNVDVSGFDDRETGDVATFARNRADVRERIERQTR